MALDMSRFQAGVNIALGALEPEEMSRAFVAGARRALNEVISEQRGTERYRTYANRQLVRSEEGADPRYPIIYEFIWLEQAADRAKEELMKRSVAYGPGRLGHYRYMHEIFVDGAVWERGRIEPTSEVLVVNMLPYARKVHVGSKGFKATKGIYEKARQAVLREFRGLVDVELIFTEMPGGYVLKGRQPRRAAKQNNRSSAHRAGRTTLAGRKDTQAGTPMKYPALRLKMKVQ